MVAASERERVLLEVITAVVPRLRADGFVRRARQFNRRTDAGVVHALAFRKYRISQDKFGLHYAIVIPEVWEARYGQKLPVFVPVDDEIFLRVAGPAPKFCLDRSVESITADVLMAYERELVPVFDEVDSAQGFVAHYERNGRLRRELGNLAEESYGFCLAVVGQKDRAVEVLQSLCDEALWPEYVERIVGTAKRLGLNLRS
jgi:hypothetical protein